MLPDPPRSCNAGKRFNTKCCPDWAPGSVALLSAGQIFRAQHEPGLRWTDLSCQGVKLISERHRDGSVNDELALPNHMHQLDGSLCRCPSCSRLRARAHDNSRPAHVVAQLSVGLTAKASQRTGCRTARWDLPLVRAICCRKHISCKCIGATVQGQDCSAG